MEKDFQKYNECLNKLTSIYSDTNHNPFFNYNINSVNFISITSNLNKIEFID